MVTQWGMSEKIGPIAYGDGDEHVFLGRELTTRRNYSERMAQEIDSEIRRIIMECHAHARKILTEHSDEMHTIAAALLERESLDAEEVKILLGGGSLPPLRRKPWQTGEDQAQKDPDAADSLEPAAADADPEDPAGAERASTETTRDPAAEDDGEGVARTV